MKDLRYLYHYSVNKHVEIKSLFLQGIKDPKPGVSPDYLKTVSFFLDSVPEETFKHLKEKGNEPYQVDELYEHVVSIEELQKHLLPNASITIRSSTEELAFIEKNWSKEAYKMSDETYASYRFHYKMKLELHLDRQGLEFKNLKELTKSDKVKDIIRDYNATVYNAPNHPLYSAHQYASVIPHLMVSIASPVPVRNAPHIDLT